MIVVADDPKFEKASFDLISLADAPLGDDLYFSAAVTVTELGDVNGEEKPRRVVQVSDVDGGDARALAEGCCVWFLFSCHHSVNDRACWHGPSGYNITLYDGHCTSSLLELGKSIAILGLTRAAAGFHCYGNMGCILTYSTEEDP